jgi:hypothetical protein
VFAGDRVDCVPVPTADGVRVEVRTERAGEEAHVVFDAVLHAGPAVAMRTGERLADRQVVLDGEFGPGYGARVGDDLELYEREGIVHPAVWPAIANLVYAEQLVRGSWIHTRSIVRHHDVGPAGATVDVRTTVVDRYRRGGERAVCDVSIELDGRPIVTIEHEAIIDLTVR